MKSVRNTVWTICATTLLGAAASASAQTIHRQVDDAGRSTFTDQAAASDGVVVPYAAVPEKDPASASAPGIASSARSDVARALRRKSAMSSMYAATVDFNEAARRLRQARQGLQEEMESRPGEWTDGAGSKQIKERYRKRQQKLEREIVAAERRSHETSLVQSALWRSTLSKGDRKTDPLKLAQP